MGEGTASGRASGQLERIVAGRPFDFGHAALGVAGQFRGASLWSGHIGEEWVSEVDCVGDRGFIVVGIEGVEDLVFVAIDKTQELLIGCVFDLDEAAAGIPLELADDSRGGCGFDNIAINVPLDGTCSAKRSAHLSHHGL